MIIMKDIEEKYKDYTITRFKFDPKRELVWFEINKYLQKMVNFGDFVVEIGSGYCNWINSVKAKNKIAIDKFIDPKKFCEKNVKAIFGDFTKLKELKNNSVNTFLLSNFLEHLTNKEVKECIKLIRQKLKSNGIIIVIQPNYKFSVKKYFDDPTHISIWDHRSLPNFFETNGFKVIKIVPKFLPLTMNSKIPKTKFLTRLYLYSPIKFFGGQMLVIARKP